MSAADDTDLSSLSDTGDPMQEEVWFEAQWDQSLPNKIRAGMAVIELFKGAHSVFKNVNADTFLLPLNSIVVCMKLDVLQDMGWCVQNGWVPNNAACSQRMASIWAEREGKRVFLLFSVKTTKQFCAFAEMIGTTDYNVNVDGWSKEGCNGAVPVTFLYIKNVPFTIINHMASKENGQPITNMWNSMMYNNQQAREVVMRYIKHPTVSSILLYPPGTQPLPANFGLLLPSSGHSSYSASSFGSDHNKIHDRRSALVAYNRPAPDHRNPDAPWRSLGTPRSVAGTPTHSALKTNPLSGLKKVGFQLLSDYGDEESGSDQSSTFTTPDEQIIAGFHQARQQSAGGQSPERPSASSGTYTRGGFGALRGGLQSGSGGRAKFTGLPINTDWRNTHIAPRGFHSVDSPGSQGVSAANHVQPMEYHYQSGSPAPQSMTSPAPSTESSNSGPPVYGLGGSLRGVQPMTGIAQTQSSQHQGDKVYLPGLGMATLRQKSSHMPSSSISSQDSDGDPFRDPFKRAQQARRPRLSPSTFNPSAPPVGQPYSSQNGQSGYTVPYSAFPIMDGAGSGRVPNPTAETMKRGSPLKPQQSMPDIRKTSAALSARAPDFVPQSSKRPTIPSAALQDTQQLTPTRKTVLDMQPYSPSMGARTDGSISPEKIAAMRPAEQAKYYRVMAQKMMHKANEAELDMEIAGIEHDFDRGNLADSTTESEPSFSPPGSTTYSDPYFISPTSSDQSVIKDGTLTNSERAIIRSGTAGPPDPNSTGTTFTHHRGSGHPGGQGFTGSFDARVESNLMGIVTSPSQKASEHLPTPQRASNGFFRHDHETTRASGSPQRVMPLPEDDDDSASLSSFEGGVDVNGVDKNHS